MALCMENGIMEEGYYSFPYPYFPGYVILCQQGGFAMLGAIIGDIIGSRFEWDNIHSKDFELFGTR